VSLREAVLDSGSQTDKREWVIEPRNSSFVSRAREVWLARYLFQYFAARLIQRRITGSWIRTARFFLQPLLPVLTYTLVFNGVAGIDSGRIPYFLFILAGLSIWQLLYECLLWSTRSFQMNGSLLRKLYFPRIILPMSSLSLALLDLVIHLSLIGGACLYLYVSTGQVYVTLGSHSLFAVLAIVLCVYFGLAFGLFLSIAGASNPDIRYTLPYAMNMWLFITPVVYPITRLPTDWQWLAHVNPMTPIVELFKVGLFGPDNGISSLDPIGLVRSFVIITVVFTLGLWYFGRAEASSVDRL
jgi:lipopolysaccharide transport system permease protein